LNPGLTTVVIWPSVISMASPRPAVISTRVAMIGWMPITETRKPFHRPSSTQTPRAIATPVIRVEIAACCGEPAR
jgi:hypothetical protein